MPLHGAVAAAAAGGGALGVGFSGGGFLIPFFLGVIDMLYRDLAIIQHSAPVAGASTGAIATAAAMGLIPLDNLRAEVDHLGAFCKARGNCYGILQSAVVDAANKLLPHTAADFIRSHGGVYLAITRPAAGGGSEGGPRQVLISNFSSKGDVVATVAASAYIPLFAGPRVTTEFRGGRAYDGSFAGPGPGFLPCPPGLKYCIRISSFPAGISVGGFLVNQLLGGGKAAVATTAVAVGSMLATADVAGHVGGALAQLAAGGEAAVGAEAAQLAAVVKDLTALVTPGEGGADIWPGRFHKLPVSVLDWTIMSISPGDAPANNAMYALGRAEALSWAQHAGFPAALARTGSEDTKPASGRRRRLRSA